MPVMISHEEQDRRTKLGARLRQRRERLKLTIIRVAQVAAISTNTVGLIERGFGSPEAFQRVSDALDALSKKEGNGSPEAA